MEIGLLIAIGFALAFALTNGFHDASNAIATLVATRGATAGQAVVLSAVFNMAGAVLLGTAVADTIGKIVTVPQTQMVAVVGAGLAGACVRLDQVERALPAGIGIGLAVALLAFVHTLAPAYALLAVVGACGGFFIVPLNALLQERGRETVGAGHAIAIQNLGENGAMLAMLGVYTLALGAGTPVHWIAPLFGLGLSTAIAALWITRQRGG